MGTSTDTVIYMTTATTTAADGLDELRELTRLSREARRHLHLVAAQRAAAAARLNRDGVPLSTIAAVMGMHTSPTHRLIMRGRELAAQRQDVTRADCHPSPPRRCINTKKEASA